MFSDVIRTNKYYYRSNMSINYNTWKLKALVMMLLWSSSLICTTASCKDGRVGRLASPRARAKKYSCKSCKELTIGAAHSCTSVLVWTELKCCTACMHA